MFFMLFVRSLNSPLTVSVRDKTQTEKNYQIKNYFESELFYCNTSISPTFFLSNFSCFL